MAGLYSGFFDETGTHPESKIVGVAGFISNVENWEKFSVEWENALIEFGLKDDPGYFHMTDFESRQASPYKDWSESVRHERFNKLLDIIARYEFSSVGCLIPKQQFEAIMSPFAVALCGGAYGLAAMVCFRLLAQAAIALDSWIEYSLEDGASGKGALLTVYDPEKAYGQANMSNLHMISLEFRDKRVYLPLQAADILANVLYKAFPREMGWEERRPRRYALIQLSKGLNQWHYLDDARLQAWNQELSNPTVI